MSARAASEMIWAAAGYPSGVGNTSGICKACGRPGEGQPFSEWVRSTFTDFDKLSPGDVICHACQFCFSDRNEALMRITGRDKPQRMRNYSHFIVNGEWLPCSASDKRSICAYLARSPELAVIAMSGQKHLIVRARPGWWQIEDQSALPFPDALRNAMEPIQKLYWGGFTKTEIASGCYSHAGIRRFGFDAWAEAEQIIRGLRGSLAFRLALFLAQKEQEHDA